MLDFKIAQTDFAKAVSQLTKARNAESDDLVDLTISQDSVTFVVTGRELAFPALIESLGSAQLPLSLLPRLKKIAATFSDESIRIRVEEGKVRVNSMSVSLPEIALKSLGRRMIDLPDDAPARDVLALRYLFSDTEIAESNLVGRMLGASSELQKTLDAASGLEKFGVTQNELRELIQEHLQKHAATLHGLLLPSLD